MNKSRTTYFNTLMLILGAEMILALFTTNTQDVMGLLLATLGIGMLGYGLKFTFGTIKALTLTLAVIALVWGIYILLTSENVAEWFSNVGFQVMVPLLAAAGLGAGHGPKKDIPEEGSRLFPAGPVGKHHQHNTKNVLKNVSFSRILFLGILLVVVVLIVLCALNPSNTPAIPLDIANFAFIPLMSRNINRGVKKSNGLPACFVNFLGIGLLAVLTAGLCSLGWTILTEFINPGVILGVLGGLVGIFLIWYFYPSFRRP